MDRFLKRRRSSASAVTIAESQARHVRQIVVRITPTATIPPRVQSLHASGPMMITPWAASILYVQPLLGGSGEVPSDKGPFIFARAQGIIDLVKNQTVTCAFAFYRLKQDGVFQIFIEVDHPKIRARSKYPYIAEHTRSLDDDDNCRIVRELINREKIEICFVASGNGGPCTGYFGLQFELPEAVKTTINQEFDSLLLYRQNLPDRDYEAALDQYNQENPLEKSPILPRS